MSLPKRDGVHGRYYLIHKPDTDSEVLEQADQCIQDVLDGTAEENHSGYPVVVRNQNGTPFLPSQLLERYLSKLPLKGFPYADVVAFCNALRRLAGWKEIDHTLGQYIEHQVQERYFEVGEKADYFSAYPPCTVWPELRPEDVDDGLLRFACYVAVCYTVYGASYDSLTTEHILGLVSQIRPDMVKQLKTAGSGKLPKDIQRRKTEHFTASANDAFATIRITARDSTEECYGEILDYLCAVLEQEEFPRSYSVEFRGPEKIYLPIPGLPKKGINQLFACAVQYPNLHPAMARYARLAMREFEWYQNLADEACAMPGTFAVFALGLEGELWAPLVTEYLDLCDDEHSSLQGKFLHALIRKFGFQPWTLGVLVRGALSMQWLEPAREFRSLIARLSPAGRKRRPEIPGHRLAEPALGHMGPGLRKRRQQGYQVGTEGTERAVSGNFSIGGNKMKTFDPNYKLLDEMYQDDYYPAFLVDKVKDELQKVIDLLESGETDTEVVQEKLDEAVCGINDLQDEFYENDSEIETVARDCIGVTVDYILKWFGIPIDMEEAIRERDW